MYVCRMCIVYCMYVLYILLDNLWHEKVSTWSCEAHVCFAGFRPFVFVNANFVVVLEPLLLGLVVQRVLATPLAGIVSKWVIVRTMRCVVTPTYINVRMVDTEKFGPLSFYRYNAEKGNGLLNMLERVLFLHSPIKMSLACPTNRYRSTWPPSGGKLCNRLAA